MPLKGHKHSEESKRKIREARANQIITKETGLKISKANKGRKHLEETKRKISKALKGKPKSDEAIKHFREAKSKPFSAEMRRKFSEAAIKRGMRNTPEVFWSKVDIKGVDDCWEWTGYKDKNNYGVIKINGNRMPQKAHRIAFFLSGGIVTPEKQCICHHCDNPICCNPSHLFAGSIADNNRDMQMKGRYFKGKRINRVSKMRAYMGFSRSAGSKEGAVLVFAHSAQEARMLTYKHGVVVEDYLDTAVRWLRDSLLFDFADSEKLARDEPHISVGIPD